MNNNVSTNCFGCNGDSTIWILILLLLFGNGNCGNSCNNSCGMDSFIIIIFLLFFMSGGNGIF